MKKRDNTRWKNEWRKSK